MSKTNSIDNITKQIVCPCSLYHRYIYLKIISITVLWNPWKLLAPSSFQTSQRMTLMAMVQVLMHSKQQPLSYQKYANIADEKNASYNLPCVCWVIVLNVCLRTRLVIVEQRLRCSSVRRCPRCDEKEASWRFHGQVWRQFGQQVSDQNVLYSKTTDQPVKGKPNLPTRRTGNERRI